MTKPQIDEDRQAAQEQAKIICEKYLRGMGVILARVAHGNYEPYRPSETLMDMITDAILNAKGIHA